MEVAVAEDPAGWHIDEEELSQSDAGIQQVEDDVLELPNRHLFQNFLATSLTESLRWARTGVISTFLLDGVEHLKMINALRAEFFRG